MPVRTNLWDPLAGDGIDAATTPDGGILFPDQGAFQFDASAPAAATDDWSDIAVDIDFIDDALTFGDTTALQEVNSADTPAAPQDETRTFWTPLDELLALYPGAVWPPMSEWASATNDNDPSPDTASPDDACIVTVQNLGLAGLDWWVTPDFDDDPGWIPSPSQTSATVDDGTTPPDASLDAGPAVTDTTDVPREETLSLTPAELNEQYPGIVWPANWWLL